MVDGACKQYADAVGGRRGIVVENVCGDKVTEFILLGGGDTSELLQEYNVRLKVLYDVYVTLGVFAASVDGCNNKRVVVCYDVAVEGMHECVPLCA